MEKKKLKKVKIEKQLIGRGGRTISHSTILLMRISVLTGEVKVYTTIPSRTKNNTRHCDVIGILRNKMREKSTSKNFLRFRKIIYNFLNNDSPLQYSTFKDKNLQIAAVFASSTVLLK
jgi:DNA-binding cell septation regulator SpoVG